MITVENLLEVSFDELEENISTGWVRRQFHNNEPLAILNYTEKCTFDRRWNRVTRFCRGLIYNTETHEVVARGFPKFFNHNEPDAPQFQLDEPVIVTDKIDGSLGILYPKPSGGWAIATRGSFHSGQAEHGTNLLSKYSYNTEYYKNNYTWLFEIIYPENRIVLDYKGQDELVLIGAQCLEKDFVLSPIGSKELISWNGPCTEVFSDIKTFAEALAFPPRENAEGLVIRKFGPNDTNSDMVKIKQDDYLCLHRAIMGLNAKAIWEVIKNSTNYREVVEKVKSINDSLPEEFWGWVADTAAELYMHLEYIYRAVATTYNHIEESLGLEFTRAQFAAKAKEYEYPGLLFLYHDENLEKLNEAIWKMVKPKANETPYSRSDNE